MLDREQEKQMPADLRTKVLLPSFTGTMYRLMDDVLLESDLKNALFFYGCTREHALRPGYHGEYNELKDLERRHGVQATMFVHCNLVKAILKAEEEGRVSWRPESPAREEPEECMDRLNDLLTSNGYPPLDFSEEQPHYRPTYPGIQAQVLAQELELYVIF